MKAERSKATHGGVTATTWALIALLLVAGLVGAWQTRERLVQYQLQRFNYEAGRVQWTIQKRMTAYVQILRGGLGLFMASDEVSRRDWSNYVRTLEVERRYPGIRQMSFIAAVRPEDVAAFVARVRAEPLPPGLTDPAVLRNYRLHAPPQPMVPSVPKIHAPVLYAEPLTPLTERSLGVDNMQDAGRRAVMETAIASDDAVLSHRLRLRQISGTQVGFIAYLAARRNGELLGWVSAGFFAEAFMHGLLGGEQAPLRFAVYDGGQVQPESLLYSTAGLGSDGEPRPLPPHPSSFSTVVPIELPGRQWTLYVEAAPDYVSLPDRLAPWFVVLGALLASLMLYAIARSGARWQRQTVVLEQARRAVESATQAKSDFLASMSHEIRTPLNAIVGNAELLGDTALDTDQQQILETIQQSGDHLLGVINDILDFSKVEAGMLELENEIFDLRSVVGESLELVALSATQKGLGLNCEFAPETPSLLRGDRGRVRQVLVNYLSNAIKFTVQGEIAASVSATPLSEHRQLLRIAVRDTGIGIAADRQDRLFKTFSQVDASTTRRYGGSGLGLAICKRLAERMGGSVGVESQAGRGSLFWFSFVADSDPAWAPPAMAPAQRAAPTTPLRILVAEDNALNQQVALRMLASLGYRADLAANGLEAVEAVQRQDYDLVLMDLQMPVMDGFEATRRIRALEHRPQPKIYAVSASVLDHERRACIEAGMQHHLAKPFRRADLERVLREVAGSTALASEPAALARLASDLGREGAVEIVDAVIAAMPARLRALREALAAGDLQRLAAVAQELRADCELTGADPLAADCASLAAETGLDRAAPMLDAIDTACAAHLAALREWRG
ncbi:MAG: CHASE domain-containing protein [Stagnimonas sp.]|nr:CHASE domain-containing protein [Stagnimonas sp.]